MSILINRLFILTFFLSFLSLPLTCKDFSRKSIFHRRPLVSRDSSIPAIPDTLCKALSRYQNSRGATLQDWAPGGDGIIIITRFGESNQIHYVKKPGADRKQLTFVSEGVIRATVCPDASRRTVLFTQDSGGNENLQLYAMNLDSLQPHCCTHGPYQNDGIVWSNRGDRFIFESNRRNGTDFDLYISDMSKPSEARLVLANGGAWSALEWSPDDRRIIVSKYLSRTDSHLFILTPATGELVPLHDTAKTVSEELAVWGPAGRGIFFTSDDNTDVRTLRYYDCATKQEKILTSAIHWDVREIAISKDRTLLAISFNRHGFSDLYLMNTTNFTLRKIPGLPQAVILNLRFHPSGNYLAMSANMPQQPEDVYVVNTRDLSCERWTESELGEIDKREMVAPELVEYPTFDSSNGKPRMIPCFLYKPTNGNGPFPVLILIHGGPESQYWPYFTPIIQYYVTEMGIAVLAPNVRGSNGYGKAYLDLDNGYKRENAVRDIGALIDWIGCQPYLDSSRIAVSGGSYGGYMSLASMIRYNNRLKAGIDCYGISNYITFLEHTASYRRDLRRVEYGDERDPAMRKFLLKISPLTNAHSITKPLLIVQGANDPRVPAEESQQIADAVRKNGRVAWLLMAADEGHGYRKKSNRDYQELVTVLFLKKFLVGN